MTEHLRKGWCPGALAPMLSGDGYIFRIRLANGVLSFERAKVLASLARRFGNGAFDLSARANLQMRGVPAEKIDSLQDELRAMGLLDSDARAEAVRNVVPSPLAGCDPSAMLDARPLVASLDAMLTREKTLHDLPPKFGFSVDGGGLLPLNGVETDIGFSTVEGDPARLTVSLGGAPAGYVAPENLCAAAEGLARNFLRLRGDDRRMSAVVARLGAAAVIKGVSVLASHRASKTPVVRRVMAKQSTHQQSQGGLLRRSAPRNDGADHAKILGAQVCGEGAFVGAGLLFGRIDADALEALAQQAQVFGAHELRLTPWRAILAVGLAPIAAKELATQFAALGLLLDARDSRLAFAACPGAPACPSARGDVRAMALALAPHWPADAGRIHISGCIKGCAFNAPAITLVAEDGGYALIDYGLARENPSERTLDLADIQSRLKTLAQGSRV